MFIDATTTNYAYVARDIGTTTAQVDTSGVTPRRPRPLLPPTTRNTEALSTASVTTMPNLAPAFGEQFAAFFRKLAKMSIDPDTAFEGLNERPNVRSLQVAEALLVELYRISLTPTHVVASAEGGIGICFDHQTKYADFEVLNNGSILAVTSNRRDDPVVWDVVAQGGNGILETVLRVRDYLRG